MRLLLYGYIPIKDLSGYYLNLPHAKSKIVLPSGKTSKNFFEKQKLKARFKKNKKHFSMVKRGIKLFNSEGLSTVQYNLSVEKKAQSYTFLFGLFVRRIFIRVIRLLYLAFFLT